MVTKERGDAFSRQHTRLWQWTFDYGHDAFELGVNREQLIVASGIDDILFPLLSLLVLIRDHLFVSVNRHVYWPVYLPFLLAPTLSPRFTSDRLS